MLYNRRLTGLSVRAVTYIATSPTTLLKQRMKVYAIFSSKVPLLCTSSRYICCTFGLDVLFCVKNVCQNDIVRDLSQISLWLFIEIYFRVNSRWKTNHALRGSCLIFRSGIPQKLNSNSRSIWVQRSSARSLRIGLTFSCQTQWFLSDCFPGSYLTIKAVLLNAAVVYDAKIKRNKQFGQQPECALSHVSRRDTDDWLTSS